MRDTRREGSWIAYPRATPGASYRLFCLPYAGGGTRLFRPWQDELQPGIQVLPVQLPGREGRLRELAFTDVAMLVEALARAITPLLDIPFAFFGHSMGALVSFELARQLRRQSSPTPHHLFVSSNIAPQAAIPGKPLHLLAEPDFIQALRRLNGTPEEILRNADLMQLLLPTLRADFELSETYIYQDEPPLDCPISVFGGLQDTEVTLGDLEGWRKQTRSSFQIRMFPGGHFYLDSAWPQLLRAIAEDLGCAASPSKIEN